MTYEMYLKNDCFIERMNTKYFGKCVITNYINARTQQIGLYHLYRGLQS